MARALMGHVGLPSEPALAYEVVRLRRRIAELEGELAQLREHGAAAGSEPMHRETIDLELHRLATESEPALA